MKGETFVELAAKVMLDRNVSVCLLLLLFSVMSFSQIDAIGCLLVVIKRDHHSYNWPSKLLTKIASNDGTSLITMNSEERASASCLAQNNRKQWPPFDG